MMQALLTSALVASAAAAVIKPAVLSSPGCGATHLTGWQNDTSVHSIVSGNRTRTYAVYVPLNYNANVYEAHPVIFDFHGRANTAYTQYLNSQYYLNPGAKDYIVVYPQGVNDAWQGPSYATPGVNDVQFVADLLAKVNEKYCVDPQRVYASGKSNGGGFVDTLACSNVGDSFAAFAMASAALYVDDSLAACSKRRAIMESHGLADTTIPYAGGSGRGGDLPDITTWIGWWTQRTCGNATIPAAVNTTVSGYTLDTFSCNGWTDVVKHYKVNALAHCWPCATGNNYDALNGRDCLDRVLNYTQSVVDYFGQWTLATAPSN